MAEKTIPAGKLPAELLVRLLGAFAAEPGRGVRSLDGRAIPWPERDEVARALAK